MTRKMSDGLLNHMSHRLLRRFTAKVCGRGIRILFVHRVLDDSVSEERDWPRALGHPTRSEFERKIRYLVRHYRPITLDMCVELLRSGEPPQEEYCVITFDDGYADNLRNACPVMREYRVPATFFVSTGVIGTSSLLWVDQIYHAFACAERGMLTSEWLGAEMPLETLRERMVAAKGMANLMKRLSGRERARRHAALLDWLGGAGPVSERDRMLRLDEIREIARDPLFSLGGHTRWHPILSRSASETAEREIGECRDDIRHLIGEPPRHFAYPNGKERDFTPLHAQLVRRAGFDSASTTEDGTNLPGADLYSLRRVPLVPLKWVNAAGRHFDEPLVHFGLRMAGVREVKQWARTRLRKRARRATGDASPARSRERP